MANDVSAAVPKIVAGVLPTLRKAAVMPQLINIDYSDTARQKGDTIDVPMPGAITTVSVSPAATPPVTTGVTPEKATITLDQWYEAPFYLTDKEVLDAVAGIVPRQAEAAIKSLAEHLNAAILNLYKGIYGYTGTAGTTPFASDVTDAVQARKILLQQQCPVGDRRCVLSPEAEAQGLMIRAFQDASFSASGGQELREGQIGRKLGFDFYVDQQMPTHTSGAATSSTTGTAGYALGIKTVALASAGTGAFLVGDVITFAGDTQTYVITSGDADVSGGGSISFEPGLKVVLPASNVAITCKATHVVNLAFHRDAFALAVRPVQDVAITDAQRQASQTVRDPVTGLVFRLEVTREYKRTRWSFDCLYGCAVLRREYACRIAG